MAIFTAQREECMSGIEVLVITADSTTSEAVLSPWDDGIVHVSSSTMEGMRLLDNASVDVVALDFNGEIDNLECALSDIRDLTPTAALIVLCEKEQVKEITESEISASIFRILPKPLAISQSQSVFKSAYSHHLELEARQASGENLAIPLALEEQPSQLKYLFFLCLITFAVWFMYDSFNEADDREHLAEVVIKNPQNRSLEMSSQADDQLKQLYRQAQISANAFQLQSAAILYDQILKIDPYDGDALTGHESIKELLTERVEIAISNNNPLDAQIQLDELTKLYPDHRLITDLSAKLLQRNQSTTALLPVTSAIDSATKITSPNSVSNNIENQTESTLTSESIYPVINQTLQDSNDDEIVLPLNPVFAKIDTALESSADDKLPTSDAFRLLLAKVNVDPLSPQYAERLDELQQRIHTFGLSLINEGHSDKLATLTQEIRSFPSMASLADSLDQTMLTTSQSIVNDSSITPSSVEIQPPAAPNSMSVIAASSKIIPAVKISGSNPKYPKNAERRGIEGLVELEFTITRMGQVTSVSITRTNPEGIFDEAAITAVLSWRYQPRLIDSQPVSERKQVRLSFRL